MAVPVLLKESGGETLVPNASCTANTMDVLFNIGREIVVDDMLNHGNIKSSRSNRGGNKNTRASRAKVPQSLFSLTLKPIPIGGKATKVKSNTETQYGDTYCENAPMAVKQCEDAGLPMDAGSGKVFL